MGPPFCDVTTPLHEPTPVAAAATSGEMAELGAWTPGPGSEDTLLPLLYTAQFYPDRCLMSSMVTVNMFFCSVSIMLLPLRKKFVCGTCRLLCHNAISIPIFKTIGSNYMTSTTQLKCT